MTPEEKARLKIDKVLETAGWRVVSRDEFVPNDALAVKEGLMQGNKEADYLLFLMGKAVGVIEAKRDDIELLRAHWSGRRLYRYFTILVSILAKASSACLALKR